MDKIFRISFCEGDIRHPAFRVPPRNTAGIHRNTATYIFTFFLFLPLTYLILNSLKVISVIPHSAFRHGIPLEYRRNTATYTFFLLSLPISYLISYSVKVISVIPRSAFRYRIRHIYMMYTTPCHGYLTSMFYAVYVFYVK